MPRSTKLRVSESDMTTKLLQTLSLLAQYDKQLNRTDAYMEHVQNYSFGRQNLGKSFGMVTKGCLVSHRFHAAAQMLEILSLEYSCIDHFLFMAGLQVLENHPEASEEILHYFIRHVQSLPSLNKREVALEYLIFVLKNKKIHSAQSGLKNLISQQWKRTLRTNYIIDPLLKAYTGLLDYIEWDKSYNEGDQDQLVRSKAEKAIVAFQEIIELPGQWDIFVLKLTKMLEYYGRLDEVEAALMKYVEMNPLHINSYMYICIFLQKYSQDSGKLLFYLQELARLCPSDPHVLILVELLEGTENSVEKRLRLLFIFLDYPSNKENSEAWKKLSSLLLHILRFPMMLEVQAMKTCWHERLTFWNAIHFDSQSLKLNSKKDGKVAVHKAAVIYLFNGDHPYVQALQNMLPNVYNKMSLKLARILNRIENLKKNSSLDEDSDDASLCLL